MASAQSVDHRETGPRMRRSLASKAASMSVPCVLAFDTALGWMALGVREEIVCRLTLGHPSRGAALATLGTACSRPPGGHRHADSLRQRLKGYAEGNGDDFYDVAVDLDGLSDFQHAVTQCCRRIPVGQTVTYGQLASRAGYEGAARAVGTVMAQNRIALIVPCHRIVATGGQLGGYSSPAGIAMKRRLIQMEAGEATSDRVRRMDEAGIPRGSGKQRPVGAVCRLGVGQGTRR